MGNTPERFKVDLTAVERLELEAVLRSQSVGAAKLRRARILLLSDVGHPEGGRTDANTSELVGLCERQMVRIRQRFVRERADTPVPEICERRPRPPRSPSGTGRQARGMEAGGRQVRSARRLLAVHVRQPG